MNPATLEFYLPLIIRNNKQMSSNNPATTTTSDATSGSAIPGKDVGGGAGVHSREKTWLDQDARFRRSLPDQTYVKRVAYRGVLMRVCAHLQILDGVTIIAKERKKAEMLLQGLENV
jgi:protein NUD1